MTSGSVSCIINFGAFIEPNEGIEWEPRVVFRGWQCSWYEFSSLGQPVLIQIFATCMSRLYAICTLCHSESCNVFLVMSLLAYLYIFHVQHCLSVSPACLGLELSLSHPYTIQSDVMIVIQDTNISLSPFH